MIPAGIMPWATWLNDHPETLVLYVDLRGFGRRERLDDNYVIGIALGEHAKAYPFEPASKEGMINDWIGPFPVVVLANAETKAVYAYIRRVGDKELEFTLLDERLVDRQTGSAWDIARGIAVDGPLRGELLQRVPYSSAYRWAWRGFYPDSEFYEGSR